MNLFIDKYNIITIKILNKNIKPKIIKNITIISFSKITSHLYKYSLLI